jgi:hypothetical protein
LKNQLILSFLNPLKMKPNHPHEDIKQSQDHNARFTSLELMATQEPH